VPLEHRRIRRLALVLALLVAASCVAGPPAVTPLPTTPGPTATFPPSETASPSPTAAPTLVPPAPPTPSAPGSAVPSAPTGRAPYCAVADVLTPHRSYDEYARTALDRTYMVDAGYVPPDLTAVDGIRIRSIVTPDLAAIREAAAKAGVRLAVVSAYRSYADQRATFDHWVSVGGYEQALRTSARPGHSEHQLGTTLDFGDGRVVPWQYVDWATTPTGAWVAAHATEFGFVMTMPKGKSDVVCYDYEPWHYRWVGRETAARVAASGLTLREYQDRAP